VIAPDVRVDHVRPEELAALVRFVTEPPSGARVGDLRHGLVLVTRNGRPVRLADLRAGFVPLPAWLPRDPDACEKLPGSACQKLTTRRADDIRRSAGDGRWKAGPLALA